LTNLTTTDIKIYLHWPLSQFWLFF